MKRKYMAFGMLPPFCCRGCLSCLIQDREKGPLKYLNFVENLFRPVHAVPRFKGHPNGFSLIVTWVAIASGKRRLTKAVTVLSISA